MTHPESQIYLGDCLELMKDIPSGSIDAIITDPPYGTTACKWDSIIPFNLMWEQLNRIIKPNGAIVLFGSEPFSSALRMSNIKNYKYDWIWSKGKPSNPALAKKQPLKYHEFIHIFYKSFPLYNPIMTKGKKNHSVGKGLRRKDNESNANMKKVITRMDGIKYPKSILEINRESKPVHPTQKPVELMEYLIKTYTNENETVLDFTAGSGTTAIACLNTNRNFIVMEKEPMYYEIITNRIANFKPIEIPLTLF